MGPGSRASTKTALRAGSLSPFLLPPQSLIPGSPAGAELMNSECLLDVCSRASHHLPAKQSKKEHMARPLGGRHAQSQVPWWLAADLPQVFPSLPMDCGQTPVFSSTLFLLLPFPPQGQLIYYSKLSVIPGSYSKHPTEKLCEPQCHCGIEPLIIPNHTHPFCRVNPFSSAPRIAGSRQPLVSAWRR